MGETYITGFKSKQTDDILIIKDKNAYTKEEVNALLKSSNSGISIYTDLDEKPTLIENTIINILFTKTYTDKPNLWEYSLDLIYGIPENTIISFLYKDDKLTIIGNPIVDCSYSENVNYERFANGNLHIWMKSNVDYSDTVEEKEFVFPVKFKEWISKYEKFSMTNGTSSGSSVDRAMYGVITPNLFADIVTIDNTKAVVKYAKVSNIGIDVWGR